jgi:hypothetical protein
MKGKLGPFTEAELRRAAGIHWAAAHSVTKTGLPVSRDPKGSRGALRRS